MSHQPTGTEALVAAFSFNKNLHQAKLDWRFNEQFTDPRWATAFVGAELLAQQERAAKRYDHQATALLSSVENQTRQNEQNARALQATIKESSETVRREMAHVQDAVKATTSAVNALASQVSHLAWLQAEQNETLRQVLETIREGRANECRQLVEQGERNFEAGFLPEAEERFRLALGFDNTDYPTHQNLGLTLVRLGRLDEALDHFKKALAFPPKRQANAASFFVARAATHAARVLYAKSDYGAAETYLERALDADPKSSKNWYDLAVMRTYLGKSDGAIEALRHAIENDAMFAGAALADEELASIRTAVEDLVLGQTARATQTRLAKPAEALQATAALLAEIQRTIQVEMPRSADANEIVRRARDRGTLPAVMEAVSTLQKERADLLRRAADVLERAKLEWSATAEKRLAAHRRQSQDEENEARDSQFAAQEAMNKSFLFTRASTKAEFERARAEVSRLHEAARMREVEMHRESREREMLIEGYLIDVRKLIRT